MDEITRTVLIVDDDPQILHLLEQMLSPRGRVKVVSAPKAVDALRIFEREPVHLLISDIMMPEMDGGKLAERFLKLHPKGAVLLISGHYRESVLAKSPRIRFLRKPFFPADLVRNVRELLPEV